MGPKTWRCGVFLVGQDFLRVKVGVRGNSRRVGGWRSSPMAKKPCVHCRAPKRLTHTLCKHTERGALKVRFIAPRSARVFEAIYFISPFESLPFFLTSSTASSFHSSSLYGTFTLKIPMETLEEKRTIRLMLPLSRFRISSWKVDGAPNERRDLRYFDGRFQNTEGTVDGRTDEYYL